MSFHPDALSLKLGAFATLKPEDMTMMGRFQGPRTTISAGKEVVYEGQHGHAAYVLREGWVCSYKRLQDGARQVIDIQVPGDFLGLRSLLLRKSDHSFVALTDIEVSRIIAERLWDTLRTTPRLAAAVMWAMSRDQAMVVEHLVNVGRRDALARTAHFLLELGARMRLVGRDLPEGFECPLSQNTLADALGITAIHLNRVLRQLRESNLLVFRDGFVTFLDMERLIEITGFDLTYLDQEALVG